MNEAESSAVLELAEALTAQQRRAALSKLSSGRGIRMDAEARRRLAALREEVRADHLRPLANTPNGLVPLASGPRPMLPESVAAVADEWARMWGEADRLRDAGVAPPGPLLLHGPTGTGKTMLAAHIAGQLSETYAPFVLDAHNIVDSHIGSTGSGLAKVFDWAARSPVMLVIEEVDALSVARGGEGSAASNEGNRITVALMRLIEAATAPIVITTNRVGEIDAALLRRIEYQCEVPMPTAQTKREIVEAVLGAGPLFRLPDSLAEGVAIARRARRLAIVNGEDAVVAFDRLARAMEEA